MAAYALAEAVDLDEVHVLAVALPGETATVPLSDWNASKVGFPRGFEARAVVNPGEIEAACEDPEDRRGDLDRA